MPYYDICEGAFMYLMNLFIPSKKPRKSLLSQVPVYLCPYLAYLQQPWYPMTEWFYMITFPQYRPTTPKPANITPHFLSVEPIGEYLGADALKPLPVLRITSPLLHWVMTSERCNPEALFPSNNAQTASPAFCFCSGDETPQHRTLPTAEEFKSLICHGKEKEKKAKEIITELPPGKQLS